MTCQEFEELSGAYILDAVTPEERRAALEHLAHCPKCTHLLRELQSVVDILPLSVPLVEPSPSLKERILSDIRANKVDNPRPISPLPSVSAAPVQPPQIRRQSRSIWRRWRTQIAVIAVVLVLVLLSVMVVWNISLQKQITNMQSVATRSYSIRGSAMMTGVQGQLTYFPEQHLSMLVMYGLPQLKGVHVYQGWLLQGKHLMSVGLLHVRDGVATVNFQGDVRGFAAVEVSLEPGPRASRDAPQGPVVAVGSLAQPTAGNSTDFHLGYRHLLLNCRLF